MIISWLLPCLTCTCIDEYKWFAYRKFDCGLDKIPNNIPSDAKIVWLSRNFISTIKPRTFAHIMGCTDLWLNNNRLTRIGTNTFEVLNKLQVLGLGNNQISYIEPGSFSHMHLIRLFLDNNQLTEPIEQRELIHSDHLTLLLTDNPLYCDWKMCWIKEGERDGWITLYQRKWWKPTCTSYPGIPWDYIKLKCVVEGICATFLIGWSHNRLFLY